MISLSKIRPHRKTTELQSTFVAIAIVRNQLYHLNVYKSDAIHPWVLRELADGIAEPFSIVYKRSGEVPIDWKLASVIPV